jgi:hypothetical protein
LFILLQDISFPYCSPHIFTCAHRKVKIIKKHSQGVGRVPVEVGELSGIGQRKAAQEEAGGQNQSRRHLEEEGKVEYSQ